MDHYRSLSVLGRPIRVFMGVFSLLFASLIIFLGSKTHFTPFLIGVLVLCAYFPFGWVLSRRFTVARHYRRHASQYVECTATFTNEAVSVSSVPVDTRLNWDQLSFVGSTPRGLLFMAPPCQTWFWLPERVFAGNDHKAAILSLAAGHNIPIRRMT